MRRKSRPNSIRAIHLCQQQAIVLLTLATLVVTTYWSLSLRTTGHDAELPLLTSSPILTMGILTDVQYAPIPDGASFEGVPRYYRHALEVTKIAAKAFEDEGVDLVVNLGDSIDGKCRELGTNGETSGGDNGGGEEGSPSNVAMEEFLRALSVYRSGPILHMYGNHDLYNFDRETIGSKLGIPFVKESTGDLVGYYSRLVTSPASHKQLRIVVLDAYDASILRRQTSSSKHVLASLILSTHNPKNYATDPNSSDGLTSFSRRYVAYNGALDNPQLLWLRKTLRSALHKRETVLIFSHVPILPSSASLEPNSLVWNYRNVLAVLRDYKGAIAMVLQGHIHGGGYGRDEVSGIHFRGWRGVIEGVGETYGILEVYGDRLVVRGVGECESGVYDLGHLEV